MIIETERQEFLDMLAHGTQFEDGWVAISLIIPPEWLHELSISEQEKKAIIDAGKTILSSLQNGYFARIGWASYLCAVHGDIEEIRKVIQRKLEIIKSKDSHCGLWKFSMESLGKREPQKVFKNLEWSSYEKARNPL